MESRRKLRSAFLSAACIYFVTTMAIFSMAADKSHPKAHKVTITGPIVVHEGDVVQILNWKDSSIHGFKVTDRTTIRCDKGFLHGKEAMNASALVPALTVEVEATSSPDGTAEAQTIRFNPETFALTVAQEKQTGDSCSYTPDRFILSWLLP
jgi:hypothetical protein